MGSCEGDRFGFAQFFQRHCAKRIRIANATLREVDDFLGDNSSRWIVTNFQMQSVTRCYEGSGHGLNEQDME